MNERTIQDGDEASDSTHEGKSQATSSKVVASTVTKMDESVSVKDSSSQANDESKASLHHHKNRRRGKGKVKKAPNESELAQSSEVETHAEQVIEEIDKKRRRRKRNPSNKNEHEDEEPVETIYQKVAREHVEASIQKGFAQACWSLGIVLPLHAQQAHAQVEATAPLDDTSEMLLWDSALLSIVDRAANDPRSMESLVQNLAAALPEISMQVRKAASSAPATSPTLDASDLSWDDDGSGAFFDSLLQSPHMPSKTSPSIQQQRTSRSRTFGSFSSLASLSLAVASAAVMDDEYESNFWREWDPDRPTRVAMVVEMAEAERERRISEREELTWKDRVDRAARIEWAIMAWKKGHSLSPLTVSAPNLSPATSASNSLADPAIAELPMLATASPPPLSLPTALFTTNNNVDNLGYTTSDYEVICPYSVLGCDVTMPRSELPKHLEECSYRAEVMEAKRQAHLRETYNPLDHIVVCPYTVVGCDFSCRRADLPAHLVTCAFRIERQAVKSPGQYEVVCPNTTLGCTVTCSSSQLGFHLQECQYRAKSRQEEDAERENNRQFAIDAEEEERTRRVESDTTTEIVKKRSTKDLLHEQIEGEEKTKLRHVEPTKTSPLLAPVSQLAPILMRRRERSGSDYVSLSLPPLASSSSAQADSKAKSLSLKEPTSKSLKESSSKVSESKMRALTKSPEVSDVKSASPPPTEAKRVLPVRRDRTTSETKLPTPPPVSARPIVNRKSSMDVPHVNFEMQRGSSIPVGSVLAPVRLQRSASWSLPTNTDSQDEVRSRRVSWVVQAAEIERMRMNEEIIARGGIAKKPLSSPPSKQQEEEVDSPPGRKKFILEQVLRRQKLHNAVWYPADELAFRGRRTHVHMFHSHMEQQTRLLHRALSDEIETFGRDCALWEIQSQQAVNSLVDKIRSKVVSTWIKFVSKNSPSVHMFGSFASELSVPGVSDLDLVVVPGEDPSLATSPLSSPASKRKVVSSPSPSPVRPPNKPSRSASIDSNVSVQQQTSSLLTRMRQRPVPDATTGSDQYIRDLMRDRLEAARRCRVLGEALRECDFLQNIKVIDTALVPVISMETNEITPHLDIDLTIALSNHDGIAAAEFVRMLRLRFPPLMPLVRILKAFLHSRNLANPFHGGLPSYALVLMATCSIIRSGTRVDPRQATSLSQGELVLDFLDLFGREFDYRTEAVCCNWKADFEKLGMGRHFTTELPLLRIGKRSESLSANAEVSLVVDDPIRFGNNVGRSCFAFHRVQQAFAEVLASLLQHVVKNEALGRSKSGFGGTNSLLEQVFGVKPFTKPDNM